MFSSAVWLGVSTDYELLFQMEFDLNPCAAAVSDFVPGAAGLAD
jgi:hypothetical protein